jgi:photoactive yellow protein
MPDRDGARAATGGIEEQYGALLRENARLRDEIAWLRRDNEALQREVASYRGTSDRLSIARPETDQPHSPRERAAETGAPVAAFVPPALPASGVDHTQQGLDFGAVAQLTPDKLDGLPYGLITLDARGRVIHYNDTEARLVGLPKERVIGRNFFRDVAPCTRIREFQGRFEELAADPIGIRVQTFDFVFKFAKGEQHVSVVMTPARIRGQFHVALLRRAR